ncbi:MAG: 2-dehydropantoate 2-reductase N-terminal domain-containing protein, partial [Candidatus Eiseniibacteriota bacterium]
MSRVAILGAGSWGTTLAVHLAGAGHDVSLWGRNGAELAQIERTRENRKFLPGITLPERVKVRAELEAALDQAEFIWF